MPYTILRFKKDKGSIRFRKYKENKRKGVK